MPEALWLATVQVSRVRLRTEASPMAGPSTRSNPAISKRAREDSPASGGTKGLPLMLKCMAANVPETNTLKDPGLRSSVRPVPGAIQCECRPSISFSQSSRAIRPRPIRLTLPSPWKVSAWWP